MGEQPKPVYPYKYTSCVKCNKPLRYDDDCRYNVSTYELIAEAQCCGVRYWEVRPAYYSKQVK